MKHKVRILVYLFGYTLLVNEIFYLFLLYYIHNLIFHYLHLVQLPRYVRVNVLKITTEDVIQTFCDHGYKFKDTFMQVYCIFSPLLFGFNGLLLELYDDALSKF